jgi:23S rRNA pseudouridine1911/1915/1917 synthase
MTSPPNQQWLVSESETGTRLDKWLAMPGRLGSRSRALAAIERGKVFVDEVEQVSSDAGRRLQAGEKIRLWIDRPGSSRQRYSERKTSGLHLLYEDSSLLVINKPAGLLTVPLPSQPTEPSLYDQVRNHLRSHGKLQPLIVHRIDRDTSGIVVFTKTAGAQQKLKAQFEQRSANRIYLAVVHGHPDSESGVWRDLLAWDQEELRQRPVTGRHDRASGRAKEAKEAVAHYRILERLQAATLIEVRLVTGKRHQIRIQAGLRGYPLVGEKIYTFEFPAERRIRFDRQALHAHRLSFQHPIDRRPLNFETAPPADFQALTQSLKRGFEI